MANQTVPLTTLMVGINTVMAEDDTIRGYKLAKFIKNLRNRSVPPSGSTVGQVGGTLHNKTAHSVVTDRSVELPLSGFRIGTGTAELNNTSSVTVPYFSLVSNVQRILWPVDSNVKIQQSILVPDDYDTSADAQAIKVVARSIAPSTTSFMDAEAYVVKGGSAIGSDLNPATAALATNPSTPEELSLTITYATLAKQDILDINLFPQGNTGAQVELFGAWLEYTAEE